MSFGLAGPRNQVEWNKWKLDAFWQEAKGPIEARNAGYLLLLLKEYARVKIPTYCFKKKPYSEARKTKTIWNLRRRKKYDRCFVCFLKILRPLRGTRSVIHHILSIQHGGLDLKENRVILCDHCHSEVHPWLTSQGTKKVGEGVVRNERDAVPITGPA